MAPSSLALLAVGCSASVLATGCGDDGAGATTATATQSNPVAGPAVKAATVDIASFRFEPDAMTLAAGGSVTWVNRDKAPHTAENTGEPGVGGDELFDTGRLARGQQKSITLTVPGTYHYYCVYHRFMRANVVVR